jgi:hypothetical protein
MQNKIDCDVFDNELAGLRELIGNIEVDDKAKPTLHTQSKPSLRGETLNSKEVQALKDMLVRFPQIEDSFSKI